MPVGSHASRGALPDGQSSQSSPHMFHSQPTDGSAGQVIGGAAHGTDRKGQSTARARARVAQTLLLENDLPLPAYREAELTLERQLSTRYVPTQIPFSSLRCAELLSAEDVAELAMLFDVYNVLPNGGNEASGSRSSNRGGARRDEEEEEDEMMQALRSASLAASRPFATPTASLPRATDKAASCESSRQPRDRSNRGSSSTINSLAAPASKRASPVGHTEPFPSAGRPRNVHDATPSNPLKAHRSLTPPGKGAAAAGAGASGGDAHSPRTSISSSTGYGQPLRGEDLRALAMRAPTDVDFFFPSLGKAGRKEGPLGDGDATGATAPPSVAAAAHRYRGKAGGASYSPPLPLPSKTREANATGATTPLPAATAAAGAAQWLGKRRKLRVGSGLRLSDGQLTRNEDDCALSREWLVELLLDIMARKLDDPAVAAIWLPPIAGAANSSNANGGSVNHEPNAPHGEGDQEAGGLTTGLAPLILAHAHGGGGGPLLGGGDGGGALPFTFGARNHRRGSDSGDREDPRLGDKGGSRTTLPGAASRRSSLHSCSCSAFGSTDLLATGRLGSSGVAHNAAGTTAVDPTLVVHRQRRREQRQAVLNACREELLRWAAALAQPCSSRQHPSVWQLCEEQRTMLERFHRCLLSVNGIGGGPCGRGACTASAAGEALTAAPGIFIGGGGATRPGSSYLATRRRSSCATMTMTFPADPSPQQPPPSQLRSPPAASTSRLLRSPEPRVDSRLAAGRRRESVVSIADTVEEGAGEGAGKELLSGVMGGEPPSSQTNRTRRGLKGAIPSFVVKPAGVEEEGDRRGGQPSTQQQQQQQRRTPYQSLHGSMMNLRGGDLLDQPASCADVLAQHQLPPTPLVFFGEQLDGKPSPTLRDVLLTKKGFGSGDPAAAVRQVVEGDGNALQQWRRVVRLQALAQHVLEITAPPGRASAVHALSAPSLSYPTRSVGGGGGSLEDQPRSIICWSDFSNNIIMRQPLVALPLAAAAAADGAVGPDKFPGSTSPGGPEGGAAGRTGVSELLYTRVPTMVLEEGGAGARAPAPNGASREGDYATTADGADMFDEDALLDGAAPGGQAGATSGAGGARRRRGAGRGHNASSAAGAVAATIADREDFAEELKGLHAQSADHVLVSLPHRLVITSSKDGAVKLWESQTGLFVKNALNCGTAWVLAMYLLHDDQYLLVATTNAELTILELPACAVVQKLRGCTSLVTALKTVVQPAAHHTQRFGLKPGTSGPHRLDFRSSMTPEVYAAMLKEAQLSDGDIRVAVKPIEGYVCPSAVALDVEQSLLVFGTTEGVVGVVDLSYELRRSTLLSGVSTRPTRVADVFQAHKPGVQVMGVLFASHARAVVSCAQDGTVGRAALSVPGLSLLNDPVGAAAAAAGGGGESFAAGAAVSGNPNVNVSNGGDAAALALPSGGAGSGAQMATASALKFGPPSAPLSVQHATRLMSYCAASRLFATVHSDRRVLLWSVGRATTELVHQFPQGAQDIISVAFDPHGQHIALLTEDHTVRVYDFRGFRPLAVLPTAEADDNHVQEIASVTIKCSADDADGCLVFLPEKKRLICALRGPVMYEEVRPPQEEGVRRSGAGPAGEVATAANARLRAAHELEKLEEVSEEDGTSSDGAADASRGLPSPSSADADADEARSEPHAADGDGQALRRAQRRERKAAAAAAAARAAQQRRETPTACRLEPCTSHRHGIVDLCVHPTALELHTFSLDRWKVWDLLSGRLKRESEIPRQVRQQFPVFTRTFVTSCGWTTEQRTRIIAGARAGCIATLDAATGALIHVQQVISHEDVSGGGGVGVGGTRGAAEASGTGAARPPGLALGTLTKPEGGRAHGVSATLTKAKTRTGTLSQHDRAKTKAAHAAKVSSSGAGSTSAQRRDLGDGDAGLPCALNATPSVDYRDSAVDLDVTVVMHVNTRTFICAGNTCVVRRFVPGAVHASGEEDYTEMRVHLPSTVAGGAGAAVGVGIAQAAGVSTAPPAGGEGGLAPLLGAHRSMTSGIIAAALPSVPTTISACCVVRDTHLCLGTVDSRLFFYRLVDECAPYAELTLRKRCATFSDNGTPVAPDAVEDSDDPEIGAVVGLFFLNDKNQNLLLVVLETGVMHVFAYLRNVMLARLRLCRPGECRIRKALHRSVRSVGVDSALIFGDSLGRVHVFDVSGFVSETADFRRVLGKSACVFQAATDEISALDCFMHSRTVTNIHIPDSPSASGPQADARGDSRPPASGSNLPPLSAPQRASVELHTAHTATTVNSPRGLVRLLSVEGSSAKAATQEGRGGATGEEMLCPFSPSSHQKANSDCVPTNTATATTTTTTTVTTAYLVVGSLDGNARLFTLNGSSGSLVGTAAATAAATLATENSATLSASAGPHQVHSGSRHDVNEDSGRSLSLFMSLTEASAGAGSRLPTSAVNAGACGTRGPFSALRTPAATVTTASGGATVGPARGHAGSVSASQPTRVRLSATLVGLFGLDTWSMGDGESYSREPLPPPRAAGATVDKQFLDTVLTSQARSRMLQLTLGDHHYHGTNANAALSRGGPSATLPLAQKAVVGGAGGAPARKHVALITMEERVLRRKLMHRQRTSEQLRRMEAAAATSLGEGEGGDGASPMGADDSEWAGIADAVPLKEGDLFPGASEALSIAIRKRFAKSALSLLPHPRSLKRSRHGLASHAVAAARPLFERGLTRQRVRKEHKYSRNPLIRTYPVQWLRKIGVVHQHSLIPDLDADGAPQLLPANVAFSPDAHHHLFFSHDGSRRTTEETHSSCRTSGSDQVKIAAVDDDDDAMAGNEKTAAFFLTSVPSDAPSHASGDALRAPADAQARRQMAGSGSTRGGALTPPSRGPVPSTRHGSEGDAGLPPFSVAQQQPSTAATRTDKNGAALDHDDSTSLVHLPLTTAATRSRDGSRGSLASGKGPGQVRGTSVAPSPDLTAISSTLRGDHPCKSGSAKVSKTASLSLPLSSTSRSRASFVGLALPRVTDGVGAVPSGSPRTSGAQSIGDSNASPNVRGVAGVPHIPLADTNATFEPLLPSSAAPSFLISPPSRPQEPPKGRAKSCASTNSVTLSEPPPLEPSSSSRAGAAARSGPAAGTRSHHHTQLRRYAAGRKHATSSPGALNAAKEDVTVAALHDVLAGLPNAVVAERVDQLMLAHLAKNLDRLQPAGFAPGAFADGVKQVWLKRSGDAAVVAATREATAVAAGARGGHSTLLAQQRAQHQQLLQHLCTTPREGVAAVAAVQGKDDVGGAARSHRRKRSASADSATARGLHRSADADDAWGLDLAIATLPTESVAARYGWRPAGASSAAATAVSEEEEEDEDVNHQNADGAHEGGDTDAHIPARERLQAHLARRRRQRARAALTRRRLGASEEDVAARARPSGSSSSPSGPNGSGPGHDTNPRRWLPQVSSRQALQPVSVTLPAALSHDEVAKAQLRQLQKVANAR